MILDGQHRLASPVSPLGERRQLRLVPLTQGESWLTAHVALSRAATDEHWSLATLRAFVGGRVLLGAFVDRAGHVREWLEIWIQTATDDAAVSRGSVEVFNNASLDARWSTLGGALLQSDPSAVLHTGFEARAPRPVWIDPEQDTAWPTDAGEDGDIELCVDEAALAAAGLPSYAGSSARYLWRRGQPTAGFLRVAGRDTRTQDVVPGWAAPVRGLLPVNAQAGRLLVRRHAPVDFDSYAGFLSGRGLGQAQTGSLFVFQDPVTKAPLDACDQLQQNGSFLMPTTRGLAGRFLETFHLKLMLFAQMVRGVQRQVAAQQMPMLNLSSASFRIDFAAPAGDLPILWTASAAMVDASAALVIPLSTTERRRFQRISAPESLIYSAPAGAPPVRGEGRLRVRKIAAEGDRHVLQATLETDEFVTILDSDLVYLELPVPGCAAVPVYGQLDTEEALNHQERRFRSFASEWPPEIVATLTRMTGQTFAHVRFKSVSHLGARHDLYSLGVLGARLLLTHSRHTLAESIDEVLSLARALVRADGATAAARAQQLALADARWHAALGPQHHGHGCATPDEGYRWIPMELWWDAMATLARFFPGAGVFSHADDFNDPADVPLQKTFDEPLRDLERLILHSRSLLLSDWLANREVARVLQRIR